MWLVTDDDGHASTLMAVLHGRADVPTGSGPGPDRLRCGPAGPHRGAWNSYRRGDLVQATASMVSLHCSPVSTDSELGGVVVVVVWGG